LIGDSGIVEFRASYKLNDIVKLTFKTLNIFDKERGDSLRADGNVSQTLPFGPDYFFGLRAKL